MRYTPVQVPFAMYVDDTVILVNWRAHNHQYTSAVFCMTSMHMMCDVTNPRVWSVPPLLPANGAPRGQKCLVNYVHCDPTGRTLAKVTRLIFLSELTALLVPVFAVYCMVNLTVCAYTVSHKSVIANLHVESFYVFWTCPDSHLQRISDTSIANKTVPYGQTKDSKER